MKLRPKHLFVCSEARSGAIATSAAADRRVLTALAAYRRLRALLQTALAIFSALLQPYRITVFLLLVAFQFAYAADPKDVDHVASKLSCYCGTCPHLVVTQCGCSTAGEIKADVAKMLDSGMTEKQILQSFVDQYGNTVLSSPPKSGFNWAAYALPFAAFLLGGTALFAFLKHQGNGKAQPPEPPMPAGRKQSENPEDEYYGEILNQELDRRK